MKINVWGFNGISIKGNQKRSNNIIFKVCVGDEVKHIITSIEQL